MAVTKRTRFEVLRRDNHTCQYCGGKAPDVELHVDHVIPVALGGTDAPANLVAACKDCNAGKTSIHPDSPIVESVGIRSAQYAIANANRNAHIEGDLYAAEEYQEEFLEEWNQYKHPVGGVGEDVPLPSGWRSSLTAWWKTGVPRVLITHAIEVAMSSEKVSPADTFRYFAGVVWRHLDEYDQRYPEQTAEGRVYGESDMEEHGIDEWRRGYEAGQVRAERTQSDRDFLARHIDGALVGV